MTEARTPEWHLAQADIQQRLAARYQRRGYMYDAQKALERAERHRDKAKAAA